jgi:hypothetical protein
VRVAAAAAAAAPSSSEELSLVIRFRSGSAPYGDDAVGGSKDERRIA